MDVTAHASLLRSLAEQTYGNLAGEPLRDTATVDPEHPQRGEEREVMNVIRQNRDELRAFDAADRDGQERMLERQRERVRDADERLRIAQERDALVLRRNELMRELIEQRRELQELRQVDQAAQRALANIQRFL